MPSVKKGQSRKNYLGECIPAIINEGKDQKAAVGQCEGMYDSKWKEKKNGKKPSR